MMMMGIRGGGLVLLLSLQLVAFGAAVAQGQDAQGGAPPIADAANPCVVPGATVASAAPLPHLASLLKEKKSIRVLAIGSSSTAGVGASSPNANYPNRLEIELEKTFKNLDFIMVNRGISGEIAETTAERLKIEVTVTKPDLVLWQVGTNDALSRIPASDFARIVSRTLRWIKTQNIDVVIVGMQYTKKLARDEHYKLIKDALKQAAEEVNVPLIKRYDAMQYILQTNASANLLAQDEFHLNDLGYRCMAEHVARGILVSVFSGGGLKGQPVDTPKGGAGGVAPQSN
ncbi:MAG: SGNH/GDSL hydrolase family protein [Beijerinckiaceae bacterium]